MTKNQPKQNIEFFYLLSESPNLTSELGKITLASGMLESEITKYLQKNSIQVNQYRETLGSLINKLEENTLSDRNLMTALKQCKDQRNEFTHRIYSLFSGQIEEKLLPSNKIIDSDVLTYCDYTIQLSENLKHLAHVFSKK